MKVYIFTIIKAIAVLIAFPVIGNFVMVQIMGEKLVWAEDIFMFLGAFLAIEVLAIHFPIPHPWRTVVKPSEKIKIMLVFIIMFTTAYLPIHLEIKQWWIGVVLVFIGLGSTLLIMFFRQSRKPS